MLNELSARRTMVTGGAGFIGSELTRQLAEAGAEVVAVDNLVNGKWENLAGLPGSTRLAETDVRDVDAMRGLLQGTDVVFHLACLGVRHSIHSPGENHEVNATGTLRLLEAARAAGVKRFVYVSSSEVYGTARTVPMTEDHPTFPKTVYGASKLAGECYTRAYHDTYGFPTVIIRPFNTYGPRCHHEGDSGEVIPKFLLRSLAGRPMIVFGDGTQTRDFTYVSDTAAGIIRVGFSEAAIGGTFNLGFGSEITIKQLAREVAAVAGRPATAVEHVAQRPGDVLRLYADMGKAQRLCGYSASIPLSEGLHKLKEWYESTGASPEQLLEQEIMLNWQQRDSSTHA